VFRLFRSAARSSHASLLSPCGLESDELNNRFTSFDGSGNCRQGAQYLRDQASVIRVADPNPQDRRTVALRRAQKREIPIFGHQDG